MTVLECSIRPMTPEDRIPVMDIFNYYVSNSFAAYPEQPLGYDFYERLLASSQGYPTAILQSPHEEVMGFGLLRMYHPMSAFRQTAEISYFLEQGNTRMGLGGRLLDYLLAEGAKMNLTTIMAQICSLNEASIKFHQAHGFRECGRFLGVGQKKGTRFDVVWMQRCI
jgi:L-amino acid N-acyltransferase YncA